MGVPGADDVMLNYQSTSFHDALYVRDLFGLKRAPEFDDWLVRTGLAGTDFRLAGNAGLLPEFASPADRLRRGRRPPVSCNVNLVRAGTDAAGAKARHNLEEFLAQLSMPCLDLRKALGLRKSE